MLSNPEYDVAISVAEADVSVADQLTWALKNRRVNYFYYKEHATELFGKNLLKETIRIYGKDSAYVLIISSESYARTYWATLESQVVDTFNRRKDRKLQLRIDDTIIDGLSRSKVYLEWRNNADKIADVLVNMIEREKWHSKIRRWLNKYKSPLLTVFFFIFVIVVISIAQLRSQKNLSEKVMVPGSPFIRQFLISRTEVTIGQYRQFCIASGKPFPAEAAGTDDHPAANLTYDEAVAYCKRAGGRLPTAAEWEYAATRYGRPSDRYSGSNDLQQVAYYKTNSGPTGSAHPVANKNANALGIFDMTGNVSEWCTDSLICSDSSGIKKMLRMIKGGNYSSKPKGPTGNQLLVSSAEWADPAIRKPTIGFRVVWENK